MGTKTVELSPTCLTSDKFNFSPVLRKGARLLDFEGTEFERTVNATTCNVEWKSRLEHDCRN